MRHLIYGMLVGLAVVSLTSGTALANSFENGVSATYAAFRTAASYLRTGNAGLATLDLAEASDEWNAASSAAKTNPPPAYAKDSEFNTTLNEVSRLLTETLTLAEAGDSKKAYKTILPVRGLIYDLRKRNGQRGYADCITDLNAVMDEMYTYRHDPPDFTKAGVRAHTSEVRDDYLKLLDDCIDMAPGPYLENPEFVRLTQSTKESMAAMTEAIDAGDAASYISVLRELRSFDRIIFFRFGS